MADFQSFLQALSNEDLAANTVKSYEADLQSFAKWFIDSNGEELTAANLTLTDLREYRGWLMQHHKPASVNRSLAAIRRWLTWCEARGEVSQVPTIKGVARTPLAPKAPSRVEVNRLTREAEKKGALATAVVWMLRATGCRVGELTAATLSSIHIGERSGEWHIIGKGTKERTVPLNASARAALKRYLAVRPQVKSNALLIGRGAKPLGVRGIQDMIQTLSGNMMSPHSLRHFAASELLRGEAKADPVTVARMLGHSRLDTLMIYTQPTAADLVRAANGLSEAD